MIQNNSTHDANAGPRPRKRINAQLDRQQILDATDRCLRRNGYDGATIRCIAGELNCAVGSIYLYFRDKRELLAVVAQATLEPVALAAEDGSAIEETLAAYYAAATADGEIYAMLFWLTSPAPGSRPTALPTVVQRIIEAWGRQLANNAQVAQRIWIALHGAILLRQGPDSALATLRRHQTTTIQPANGETLRRPVIIDLPREPAVNVEPSNPPALVNEDLVLL